MLPHRGYTTIRVRVGVQRSTIRARVRCFPQEDSTIRVRVRVEEHDLG